MAERSAEEEMLAEALGHWNHSARLVRSYRPPHYRWWSAVRLRDLDTERELSLVETGLFLDDGEAKNRPRARKRKEAQPRAERSSHR